MKKIILSVIFLCLFFSGCGLFDDDDGSISNALGLNSVSMSESTTWDYSASNDIFLVDEAVSSLTIKGNDLGGKSVYYAVVNISETKIESNYMKYVSEATSRNVLTSLGSENSAISATSFMKHKYYHPKVDPNLPVVTTSSARTIDNAVSIKNFPVTQLTYDESSIGTLKKTIWYAKSDDENAEDDGYVKKSVTLWAYNDACNVWVYDDDPYFATDASKKEVSEKFAASFEKFAPVERHIFGNESDEIYYTYTRTSLLSSGSWKTQPMNYLSDTGTKVNIVLYDLFEDKTDGAVMGFFNPADYYPDYTDFTKINSAITTQNDYGIYSNEGKYFYVDTYFAKEKPGETLSTLAHEFQHMIHNGVKTMKGLDTDTNFNEMMSMLCEDMMQEFLKTGDKESPKGRFPGFMIQYYLCGIRDYDGSGVDYANAYAFGSWLCRQYGGAALVKEMMKNGKVNNDCIVSAVNSLNNTNFTFNDLFAQFIKACYNDSTYTFNQNAAQTITYSSGSTTYNYPMKAINLWESGSIYDLATATEKDSDGKEFTYKEYLQKIAGTYIDSDYNYLGPAIFTNGTAMNYIYPRYGTVFKKLGHIGSGKTQLSLTFKASAGYTKQGMKLFFYIK